MLSISWKSDAENVYLLMGIILIMNKMQQIFK